MFIDLAKIFVRGGKGGDGVVAFRREIYVDKGGPSGGDGGRGGDVIFVGDQQVNSLQDFHYMQIIEAENGQNGAKQKKHGKSGEAKIVKVPVGTTVKCDEKVLVDIVSEGQEFVVAQGGDGGFGNAHFKSSTRQTPRVAELGEPGEEIELTLELKLIADVGLVGLPNAGKSTFLSVATNAHPKIADYPFTTLEPNLGVHYVGDDSLLIADIPGIIEGASEGKGLGHDFLRHIERTAVLLHLVDATSADPLADFRVIKNELKSYRIDLAARQSYLVLTKVDLIDDDHKQDLEELFAKEVEGEIFAISSVKSQGVKDLLRQVNKKVSEYRAAEADASEDSEDDIPVITADQTEAFEVKKLKNGTYEVRGAKIEKFAIRTDFSNDFGVERLKDIMQKTGILRELYRAGASPGDTIKILSHQFEL